MNRRRGVGTQRECRNHPRGDSPRSAERDQKSRPPGRFAAPVPVTIECGPRPVGVPKAEPAAKSYRVQGGDTLYAIARRNGTTVEELSAANNLAASATIRPGDRLTIPIKSR